MDKYDLAISFAGEQRNLARPIAERLDASGYSIFYDEFHQAELWGRDLTISLGDIYAREARWCLVLVSEEYIRKAWTNLERQHALSRFMEERSGYLLCLRVDGTVLPGMPSVIGYIDFVRSGLDMVHELLLQKLGAPSHEDLLPRIAEEDRELAKQVIQACYRRAVFTRMDSEIDMRAMCDSIGEALGVIQSAIPRMGDQALQYISLKLVGSLDEVQRIGSASGVATSISVERESAKRIDKQKLQAIRLLLELRRAAGVAIQLPLTLRTDHFFGLDAARQSPESSG